MSLKLEKTCQMNKELNEFLTMRQFLRISIKTAGGKTVN